LIIVALGIKKGTGLFFENSGAAPRFLKVSGN
jgi:hypothetical protein